MFHSSAAYLVIAISYTLLGHHATTGILSSRTHTSIAFAWFGLWDSFSFPLSCKTAVDNINILCHLHAMSQKCEFRRGGKYFRIEEMHRISVLLLMGVGTRLMLS